ncbi:MAG: Ig-like domain-containing protein [Caldilineales bacterium]|nr:Ig-like domain-containing protein [Caldilineales bacterium]
MQNTSQPDTRAYDLFKAAVTAALAIIVLILLLRGGAAAPGSAPAPQVASPTAVSAVTPTSEPTQPPPTPTPMPVALPRINPPQVGADGKLRLTGTGQPGAPLAVVVDGAPSATVQASADGTWSFDGQLPPGEHTVAVRTLDATGATVNETAPLAFQVPTPPVRFVLPAGPFVSRSRQSISGQGVPGSTVEVLINGAPVGKTVVGADGTWSLDVSLPTAGEHRLAARMTDAAGRLLSASEELTLRVEPAAPTVEVAPAEGALALTGTAEPGSEVAMVVDGQVIGQVKADADGKWAFTAPVEPGKRSVTVRSLAPDGTTLAEAEAVAVEVPAPSGAGAPDSGAGTAGSGPASGGAAGTGAGGSGTAGGGAAGTGAAGGGTVAGGSAGSGSAGGAAGTAGTGASGSGTAAGGSAGTGSAGGAAGTAGTGASGSGTAAGGAGGTGSAGGGVGGTGSAGGAAGTGVGGSGTAAGGAAGTGATGGGTAAGGTAGTGSAGGSAATGAGSAGSGAAGTGAAGAAGSAGQRAPEGQAYVVQPDDWLSKIALRFLGDARAYPKIVAATNLKAAEDPTFARIDNPDRIEVGWKLWIPVASWSP